jgi:hypothetical protein
MVERHTESLFGARPVQDLDVQGFLHPALGGVHGIEPVVAENCGRAGGKPLIEQEAGHATHSMAESEPSTVAAAQCKACWR